jgi:hypothetical protein
MKQKALKKREAEKKRGKEGMERCSEKLVFPRRGYLTTTNRGAKRSTNPAKLQNVLVPQTA